MESIIESRNLNQTAAGKLPVEIPTSGYFTYRTKEERPIFTKQDIKLNLPETITNLTISNNWLICLMSNKVLLRLFIKNQQKNDEVSLEQYLTGYNVTKLFCDPSGNHLLIPLSPKTNNLYPELLYLHLKETKPKRIDKFRYHEITAVAFNYNKSNEQSTGPILLGTSKGLIIACEFGIEGERLYFNNWKQLPNYIPLYGTREIEGLVFEINCNPTTAITGLEFYNVPDSNTYIILVSTVDTIYKFQNSLKSDEKLDFQNIFSPYVNIGENLLNKWTYEVKHFSSMAFNCDNNINFPKNIGWLIENIVYYARIDPAAELITDFITDLEVINIPIPNNNLQKISNSFVDSDIRNTPKAFVLTNFHIVLMYSDHITALCVLNNEKIYEEYFSEQYGILLDIFKDFNTDEIYVYTSKTIFRLKKTKEQRNVWKMYLEKNDFSLAEEYAKDNLAHLDIVLCKKAEKLFFEKNYIKSAFTYSKTKVNFEITCLKFLELNDKKPLMIYLNNKLNNLNEEDQTQITMLILWLIELHLVQISKVNGDKTVQQNELDLFLSNKRVQECCRKNYSVVHDLIASHGDIYNITNLTIANRDYDLVVNHYINKENYKQALDILKKERNPDLFYKYCPILMESMPQKTISIIMEQNNRLDPEKLIPTLICTKTETHVIQIIEYLNFAVHKLHVSNKSIHNYLVKLLAQSNEEKLLDYLQIEGKDISLIHYDVNYALRICEENEKKTASVFLQCMLELWESAIELAITFDIELAKRTASQPYDNELKRKLWLKIAKHEIKQNVNVKDALKLLKQCDLLKIDDILTYFDDLEKIDDFKIAICNALKEYNMKIQELRHEMDEAGKAADRVNEDLQSLRDRLTIISTEDKCAICEPLLLTKPFFIFPCGHKFHSDCLEKQLIPYLDMEENRKLIILKSQLENLTTTMIVTNQQNQTTTITGGQINQKTENLTREKIKNQIENILAADCLFCGVMIDAIDKPFIEENDWDRVNIDWQ